MKLLGLDPNFYIHVSGSNLCFPMIGLIWNLYFPVLHERTLGSTARPSGPPPPPSPPAPPPPPPPPPPPFLRLSREFTCMTNMQISNMENYGS